jgi:hypothetical protein
MESPSRLRESAKGPKKRLVKPTDGSAQFVGRRNGHTLAY